MNTGPLFLAPGWLGALLLVPLFLGLAWLAGRGRLARLRALIGPTRVETLSDAASSTGRRRRFFCAAFGLAAAVFAAARPTWGEPEPPPAPRGTDIVLCLDVSRSMRARDLDPSRLERARAEIAELARQLGGDRIGLVAFAGEARMLSPLTRDAEAVALLAATADELSVPRGGTDLGAAIELARGMFGAAESERAAIIVLSDGEDHGGGGRVAAAQARDAGPRVHTIGFGTAEGAKIPLGREEGGGFLRDAGGTEVLTALLPEDLQAIAEAGGGLYVDAARGRTVLAALWRGRVATGELATSTDAEVTGSRPRPANRYAWPLFIAILAWLGDFAAAGRRRRA